MSTPAVPRKDHASTKAIDDDAIARWMDEGGAGTDALRESPEPREPHATAVPRAWLGVVCIAVALGTVLTLKGIVRRRRHRGHSWRP